VANNDINAVKNALIDDIKATDEFKSVYRDIKSHGDVKDSPSAAVFLIKAEVNDENDGERVLELQYGVQLFVKSSTKKSSSGDNESFVVEKFLDIVESGFSNLLDHSMHIDIGELITIDADNVGVGFFAMKIDYKLT